MSDDTGARIDRKAQTRATFDRIAPDYDAAGPGCFAHFGRRLIDETGIEPGQRVLDIATGRGAVLLPAAERVGATGTAIGIDLSEGMVRAAQGEAASHGLRAEVRVMDAEHLAFPDASFDRVLCGFGLMFFPDLPQALAECRRVLRPGGRLGVSTWRVTQANDLETVLARLGFAAPLNVPLPLRDPAEVNDVLVAAGFAGVRVREDVATFRYASVAQYWQNARGTGMRRWLDVLDTTQTAHAMTALEEQMQPHQRGNAILLDATALLAVADR